MTIRGQMFSDVVLFVKLYRERLCEPAPDTVERNKIDGIVGDFVSSTFERISQLGPVKSLLVGTVREAAPTCRLLQI